MNRSPAVNAVTSRNLLPLALLPLFCAVAAAQPTSAPAVKADATCEVRFVVQVDAPVDAEPDQIYMSMSVYGWPEGGQAVPRVAPGLYALTLPMPDGLGVQYKFMREKSWRTVEKGPGGAEIPNRALTVPATAAHAVIFHEIPAWGDGSSAEPAPVAQLSQPSAAAPARPTQSTITGDVRVHEAVTSKELGVSRRVQVWLPPGYDADTTRRYPVMYMLDGQNVFDAKTSFIGVEWGADETADELIRAGKIPPIIIVAIDNSGDRINEYTPFVDAGRDGGQAERHLAFIVDTVKPLIDKTYRTRPERDGTAIGGASLGGLFSLYAVFARPEVFGRGAVVSPSLWWANRGVIDFVRDAEPPFPQRLWIDFDLPEGARALLDGDTYDGDRLRKTLLAKGLKEPADFRYAPQVGGQHNEAAWAARFDQILIYLFGDNVDASEKPANAD